MKILQQNIQTIRKIAKSRPKLVAMLNKNFPVELYYTDNQIEHYETGRTIPDENFIIRLAALAGVTALDLEKRKLKNEDIKFALAVPDAAAATVRNQIEIISRERVILSILAEVMSPVLNMNSDDLLKKYEDLVKETEKEVAEELRMRS